MRRFSLVAPDEPDYVLRKAVQQITFTKHASDDSGGKAILHHTDRDPSLPQSRLMMYYLHQYRGPSSIAQPPLRLSRKFYVLALQEEGLNVSMLDCLIASFETSEGSWLRDYSALGREGPWKAGDSSMLTDFFATKSEELKKERRRRLRES
nr:hypothetical protein B0A51_01172 [Rachicladosporium sp. CCFEE 5018]